jgi:hypothetical protein
MISKSKTPKTVSGEIKATANENKSVTETSGSTSELMTIGLTGYATDKRGYAARWTLSVRHMSNLLSQGMPHCKIGKRRVRIVVAEADRWMVEQFGVRRIGKENARCGRVS